MEEEKDITRNISMRQKRKKANGLFEWTEGEELNLLKKLVELSANNVGYEEFYPFLRNGTLAELSKSQIFDKIQQLKRKYLEKLESTMQIQLLAEERDEGFELSKRLWGENEIETQSASTSKALDESNMSKFEALFDRHRLELDLFTPSFLEETKKEVDELFGLQNHHFLIKANLKAQLAQLKHDSIQTRFEKHTK